MDKPDPGKPCGRMVEWAAYSQQMRMRARDAYIEAAAQLDKRPVRRRPRAKEEQQLLTEQCLANWRNALRSGALERIGPREYRMHINKQ